MHTDAAEDSPVTPVLKRQRNIARADCRKKKKEIDVGTSSSNAVAISAAEVSAPTGRPGPTVATVPSSLNVSERMLPQTPSSWKATAGASCNTSAKKNTTFSDCRGGNRNKVRRDHFLRRHTLHTRTFVNTDSHTLRPAMLRSTAYV